MKNKKHFGMLVFICLSTVVLFAFGSNKHNDQTIAVTGAVKHNKSFSFKDLASMDQIYMKDIAVIEEKTGETAPEKLRYVVCFKGVLLRDILLKAGMKYERKWEPGTFITVKSEDGKTVVFSFGEIFYSAAGRSIIIALEKDNKKIKAESGVGELLATTDIRAGRNLAGITEINVERVDLELKTYEDQKKHVVRPPTTHFIFEDMRTKSKKQYTEKEILSLKKSSFEGAVLIGECSGFRGIHSFEGTLLKDLLRDAGYKPYAPDYTRYVLIECESGFCAVFSFGEIFNSRMGNNIIIALKKDNMPLTKDDAFAMSAVNEDSKGGRSVRRINRISIY